MSLGDKGLRSSVGDGPQGGDGFRDGEREIEACYRCPGWFVRFLCLNQRLLRGAAFRAEALGELLEATLHPLGSGGELPVWATELLARGRVLPVAHQAA